MQSLHDRAVVGWLSLLVLLCTAGCGTTRMYYGETRSKDQVAVIQPASYVLTCVLQLPGCITVLRVDNDAVRLFDRAAEILPGIHRVRILRRVGNGWFQTTLVLDAKEGHVYEADGDVTGFVSPER
jgi:hypothetical protein